MSKLIVEMELPCKIYYLGGLHGTPTCPIERRICKDQKNPPSWCPIVGELPVEHGDLIDRDAYLKLLESYIESKRGVCENKEFIVALQAISKQIKCVKAVIAAEGKDDEQIH